MQVFEWVLDLVSWLRTKAMVLLRIALVLCAGGLLYGCSLPGYGAHRDSGYGKDVFHRVQRGDTLQSIAKQYGVRYDSIALLNGIHSTDDLETGQLLFVSYGANSERLAAAAKESVRTAVQPASAATTYGRPAVVVPATLRNAPKDKGQLLWPVRGGDLVSSFGPRSGSFHDGLDIAAPIGTPIYAAHDGYVAYSSDSLAGYGNVIILKSRTSLVTVYAHNSRHLVRTGQWVKRGQTIALVGSTGQSSGPHLHFEVRVHDRLGRYAAVDPSPLLQDSPNVRPRWRINESLTPLLARLVNW